MNLLIYLFLGVLTTAISQYLLYKGGLEIGSKVAPPTVAELLIESACWPIVLTFVCLLYFLIIPCGKIFDHFKSVSDKINIWIGIKWTGDPDYKPKYNCYGEREG